jgi:thioredoxin-related protein
MKKLLSFLGVTVFLVIGFSNCKKSFPEVVYPFTIISDNMDSSKATAAQRNSNIFLMIHADWCSICNIFKTTVLQSDDIKNTLANGIVTSLVDGDKTYGKPIASQYNISGFPTFLILDKNGVELSRRKGVLTEDAFKTWVTPFLK